MLQQRNIGFLLATAVACAMTEATAGGAGDNAAITGETVDRFDKGTPESAVLCLSWAATLAEGETLTLTFTVETGAEDDLSDAATLVTDTVVAATGPAGGGSLSGTLNIDVAVRAGGRYCRANVTPDLSAGDTDTAVVGGVWIFGGMDRLPQ